VNTIKLKSGVIAVLNKIIPKELYIIEFNIKQREYYTFWYTDDTDGFLLENNEKLKSFASEKEAKRFAEDNKFKLDKEILLISSDILINLNLEEFDCNLVLTYWNIMSDIAQSVHSQFLGDSKDDEVQSIYNKLFYGCNLPALKKDGEDYLPKWNEIEKKWIVKVIENGFELLLKALT